MSRRQDDFLTVSTVGSLLPQDFLVRLMDRKSDIEGHTPRAYGLYKGELLGEAIERSWARLTGAWERFTHEVETRPDEPATGITRDRWLHPLFQELGYHDLEVARGITLEEKHYPISHIYDHSPIHMLGYDIDLGARTRGRAGAASQSPHSLIQEFLNRSEDHLWGIVSNGYTLRLLRDNISLTRQAYVEFDLKGMMESQSYPDFSLLWQLCHATRLQAERPEQCWLEKWTRKVQQDGTRALDRLRGGVENAIRHLGQGFLKGGNPDLLARLRDDTRPDHLKNQDYYRQLLRAVYRLIFLFAAEDRNLLHPSDTSLEARETYNDYYSTHRLREIAGKKRGTKHPDIWKQLAVVFRSLGREEGCHELGLPALGGFLWSDQAMPDLESANIRNIDLLEAIRDLSITRDDGTVRNIDYRNMGSEELGSIYESLLELQPEINTSTARFDLEVLPGHERKQTGSYYTPTSLINELLDSALEPVLDRVVRENRAMHPVAWHDFPQQEDPPAAQAILTLKVCDPAAGSGHFLIAAAHRMARRLAAVRTGEDDPAPEHHRRALRDVIAHCIYGVDINPMAVELCKISLWMEAMDPGRSLSFLDHHIKCGNSLLGTTPELIEMGIPDDAFKPITGDDKKIASALRKRNKKEKEGQLTLDFGATSGMKEEYSRLGLAVAELESASGDSLFEIKAQEQLYGNLTGSDSYQHARLVADAWCAAFAWKKTIDTIPPVTQSILEKLISGGELPSDTEAEIRCIGKTNKFFHWHVEYPEVFLNRRDPGFDVVLGNPPWEHTELKEKEYFASSRPDIAEAPGAKRKRLIAQLETDDSALYKSFIQDKRTHDLSSHFVRNSGSFPLCGRGRINTYAIFAELNRFLTCDSGRVGCILQSGIATDDTTKLFFQDIVDSKSLVSLFDFENRKKIFLGVDSRMKFCLLTLTGKDSPCEEAEFVFFALSVDDLEDPAKRFTLSKEDIELLNPNTKTCPIFRTKRDAEITKGIYRRVPVLINENNPENGNFWGVTFKQGLFNMTSDSHLFRTRDDLESKGWILEGNIFVRGNDKYLPLYEGKMIDIYDHRKADVVISPTATNRKRQPRNLVFDEKQQPNRFAIPHSWVPQHDVEERMSGRSDKDWLVGWKDVTSPTNERTMIASMIPRVGVGHKVPLFLHKEGYAEIPTKQYSCLLAGLSSFIFDWCARQKVGNTSFTFFYLKQLPIPQPAVFMELCPWESGVILCDWISDRVLELVYTSWDMKPFAGDCGYSGSPFIWDEARRFQLRCELDAAYFRLYGIAREDVAYIMNTFPIVKRKDEQSFGEYRIRNNILSLYDSMGEVLHD